MLHYCQRSNLPQNLNLFRFHIVITAQNIFCVRIFLNQYFPFTIHRVLRAGSLIKRNFPYTLHQNTPAHLKLHNIKISSGLQQFSGHTSKLSRKKTPKKLYTCVKEPPFPTILTHRHRCPPFRNLVFSNATYHPGLAGIVRNCNRRIRSRISRKSVRGTATSAI